MNALAHYMASQFRARFGDDVKPQADGSIEVHDGNRVSHWIEIENNDAHILFMCEQTDEEVEIVYPTEDELSSEAEEDETDEPDGPDYDRTHYPRLATAPQAKTAEQMIAAGWLVSHFYEYEDDKLILWMVARPKQTMRRHHTFSHAYILPDGKMKRPKL